MNRDQAKEFYPFLQALAEGKVIECRTKPNAINGHIPNDWTELREIEYWGNVEYRIKPEPKYRPFANAEECWEEMLKHQPLGWVKFQGDLLLIIHIDDRSVGYGSACGMIIHSKFDNTLKSFTFADGKPFGIEE